MSEKDLNRKGRMKGAKNKSLYAFREAMESRGFQVATEIIKLYEEAKAFDDKKALLRWIMEYSHPKLAEADPSVEESQDENQKSDVKINLSDLLQVAKSIQP